MAGDEQVVELLTQIRDLLARQAPPAEPPVDDEGRTEVRGD